MRQRDLHVTGPLGVRDDVEGLEGQGQTWSCTGHACQTEGSASASPPESLTVRSQLGSHGVPKTQRQTCPCHPGSAEAMTPSLTPQPLPPRPCPGSPRHTSPWLFRKHGGPSARHLLSLHQEHTLPAHQGFAQLGCRKGGPLRLRVPQARAARRPEAAVPEASPR